MKKLCLLLSTILLVGTAWAGSYADISIPDLKAALASGKATVIDANGLETWKSGHIPGAIHFQSNKDVLAAMLPKDKRALIVAYCGGPACRAYQAATKVAADLGYTNVKHLSAGISGWKEVGEKTEKGS